MHKPMPAIETPPTAARSAIMRAIRSKGTKPELALEAELTRRGLSADARNDRELPGSPDFVFYTAALAVFVDSAFWHGRGRAPRTNAAWWAEKFRRNAARDKRADFLLRRAGWRVLHIDAGVCLRRPDAAVLAIVAAAGRPR